MFTKYVIKLYFRGIVFTLFYPYYHLPNFTVFKWFVYNLMFKKSPSNENFNSCFLSYLFWIGERWLSQ